MYKNNIFITTLIAGVLVFASSADALARNIKMQSHTSNSTAQAQWDLQIKTAINSRFKTISKTLTIGEGAANETGQAIGVVTVSNNTLDGFVVTVCSDNGANLVPQSTDNGEGNISYDISAKGDGFQSSIDGDLIFSDTAMIGSDAQGFVACTGKQAVLVEESAPDTATDDADAELSLHVAAEDEYKLSMAGTYNDKLVLSYIDY